nr:SDR family NAD(P)-dependent oxidoreductase [Bradyrhizobium manausense]
MPDHKRKVASITGAGRGIGKTTALVLGGRGFHVAVHDIDASTAGETTALVRKLGVEAESFAADVDDAQCRGGGRESLWPNRRPD